MLQVEGYFQWKCVHTGERANLVSCTLMSCWCAYKITFIILLIASKPDKDSYHFFDRMHIDVFIFKDVQNIGSKPQGTTLPKFFSYKSFPEVFLLTVVCKLFLPWLLYWHHVPHPEMSPSSLYVYRFHLLFMLRDLLKFHLLLSTFPRRPKRGKGWSLT